MAKKTSIISEGAEVLEQAFKEAQAAKKAAKGPALPLNLQRAKPKTPQEITDIADRIARQQMGEHVTSGKKGDTKNLAGRSMKESKRVQDLNYELERIKKIKPSPEVTGKVGEINLAIPGDQTISDYILKNLEGLDIESPQQGGARYGWGHLDKEDPLFWASGKQPATAFQNKVNRLSELYGTDEIMAHHLAMGDTANNFAMHFADANLRAIDNSELSKKSINAFNKVIQKQFPDFVGIHNPDEAYLQMQANPELRKYFNDRMKTPSITQPLGLPNGLDIQWAITEPALRNMEISLTGHSVGRLKPGVELTETADHGTYSHGIQGEILGHAPELAPFEMSFPDADMYLRSVYNPENITGTIQKVAPHQVVDPQYLDQMNEYYTRLRQIRGFAKGGPAGAFAKLLEETNSALKEAKQSKEAAKQLNRIAGSDVATSKDLTDVNDFHAGMMDEIRRRAAETKKQMDEFNYTYSPGDNIFTEWSAKNNRAPYKILDKAMTSTKMLGRDEQGNKIYAPRKPGYWVESVTPDGVQKFILPEEAISGRVDVEEYAKGGKVGKAAGILEELNKAYEEAKAIKTLTPKIEAPTIIVPKRGKIKDIQDKVRKEHGDYAARRVERAADEVPNLEHQYTQRALEREFTASNPQALMVLNPKDFEEFAHPLSPTLIGRTENYGGFNVPEDMSYDQYIEYLASIARDQGLTDVPYLRINETPEGDLIIGGHEGRHRTRALTKLGDESTLISLDPSYSLTRDEARRYKEDYVDALNARFGLDRLITPEYRPEVKGEVKRSPIIMPDLFAEGGKVNKLEQEFINADTVHMADGGWNSPNAPKTPKSPTQPMSMPDLDTLALTGKILARKGKQQLKKEWANPSPQMAVDVLGNVGADLLGMPADMIQDARGTPMKGYKPYKGVDLTPKGTPMLGSENLRGQLEKAGITSGTERPLTENLAMFAAPFAGELKGLPVGLSIKDVSAAAEEAKRAVNFVSSVERTIKSHKIDAMPGNQWSAWMKSNASKAAKKEADATGLHDWLAQQTGKVTKADIEAYVEGSLPQTKVTTRGVPKKLSEEENERYKELWKRHNDYQYGRGESLDYPEYEELMRLENIVEKKDARELRKEAEGLEKAAKAAQARGDKLTAQMNFSRSEHVANRADAMELTPELMTSTKFEKYTEPGGQNYKETTISLPKRELKPRDVDLSGYTIGTEDVDGVTYYRAITPNTSGRLYSNRNSAEQDLGVYTDNIRRSGEDTENFKVSPVHGYDVEDMDVNRLAHLRTKERLTPDEKRVLFMEELQSDWAQQARDKGFRARSAEEYYKLKNTDPNATPWEQLDENSKSMINNMFQSDTGLPRAPYVEDTKDWTALGLKHALKQAAEEGQDYLAWTTGEQQAKRYDLSKQVEQVDYHPETGVLIAYRDKQPILVETLSDENQLADYIGKEAAEKIIKMEAEPSPRIGQTTVKKLKNADLQIGGEGMKGYYDQILPQTMNDVLKQLGVSERVKTIPLKTGRDSVKVVDNYTNEPLPIDFDSYEDASSYMGDAGLGMNEYTINVTNPDLVQHMGIEITPELKEKLFSEGLPHFHDGGNVQHKPVNLNEEFKKSRYGV